MTSIYDMADTWDDAGTTFTAIKMDVTDTDSAADSMLIDLLIGGIRQFGVTKTGNVLLPGDGAILSSDGGGNSYGLEFNENDGVLVRKGTTPYFRFTANQMIGRSNTTIAWTSGSPTTTQDLILLRDAAGTLAQRNGVNAQAFNLYNTFTDASNYERLGIGFSGGDVEILQEYAGTGSRAGLKIGNDLAWWQTDNAGNVVLNFHNGDVDFKYRGTTRLAITNGGDIEFTNNRHVGNDSHPCGHIWSKEQNSDPSDPTEGNCVRWMSDGTESGDDGDIMMKITAGGVTKTVTLVDFSAA